MLGETTNHVNRREQIRVDSRDSWFCDWKLEIYPYLSGCLCPKQRPRRYQHRLILKTRIGNNSITLTGTEGGQHAGLL